MSALAPFLAESPALEDLVDLGVRVRIDPAILEQELAEQNLILARAREIPDAVRYYVEDLADDVAQHSIEATLRTDPYLLVAMQQSLLAAVRALENPRPEQARRELRVRLEQLRQVYRDLADARPVFEDRPAKELARWLAQVLDVPHARLAELLDVSPRTFQRWVSETDSSEPAGDDARRVRLVANMVGHLRHALTGRGVVEWFERPHPLIDGRAPKELLDDPDALTQLTRLAASTRSAIAA